MRGQDLKASRMASTRPVQAVSWYFTSCVRWAEFERSLISERSTAGVQAARRRGRHIGRPHKLNREQINHAAEMIREGRETVSGMAGLLNVDRTTLYRALNRK